MRGANQCKGSVNQAVVPAKGRGGGGEGGRTGQVIAVIRGRAKVCGVCVKRGSVCRINPTCAESNHR